MGLGTRSVRVFPSAVVAAALFALAVEANAGETLPKGPPWHRDLLAAHQQAAAKGKPIFAYFTKTY